MADIRAALAGIGFTAVAAPSITDTQGYDSSLSELGVLADEEVENLCKVVCRPGGTMANPSAAVAGQPAVIPNPGIAVSLRAENNLKLACFFIRYRERTSRNVVPGDITLDNIRALKVHKEWDKNTKK